MKARYTGRKRQKNDDYLLDVQLSETRINSYIHTNSKVYPYVYKLAHVKLFSFPTVNWFYQYNQRQMNIFEMINNRTNMINSPTIVMVGQGSQYL